MRSMTRALASSMGRFEGSEKIFCRGVMISRDGHVVQFQRAMDERLLKLGQNAHAARGGGDQLQFLRRVDRGPVGHGDIEAAQHHGRRVA